MLLYIHRLSLMGVSLFFSQSSIAQSFQDPSMYGVVQSGDHVGRTCVVKWFKLKPSEDDVEVRSKSPSYIRT